MSKKNKNYSNDDALLNYRTGIEKIDLQHSEWLKIYTDLKKLIHSCDLKNESLPMDQVRIVVVKMYQYARMHLKYEESFMESIGYPHLSKHKIEHRALDSAISDLFVNFFQNIPIDYHEVVDLIGDWLKNHILISDQDYVEYTHRNHIDPEKHLP